MTTKNYVQVVKDGEVKTIAEAFVGGWEQMGYSLLDTSKVRTNNIKKARNEFIRKREEGQKVTVTTIDKENEAKYLADQLAKAVKENNEGLRKWVEEQMKKLGIQKEKNVEIEKTESNGNSIEKYAGVVVGVMFISTVLSFFKK